MKCTWSGCNREATTPQYDKNGYEWANLCDHHNERLKVAVQSSKAKSLLGAWACAGKNHPARKQLEDDIVKGCGSIFEVVNKLRKKLGENG